MRRQAVVALAALAAAVCTLTACGRGTKPVAAHSAGPATPKPTAQLDASLRADADAISGAVMQLATLLQKPRTDAVYAKDAAALVTAIVGAQFLRHGDAHPRRSRSGPPQIRATADHHA